MALYVSLFLGIMLSNIGRQINNYMKYNYRVDMSYLTTMKAYIYHKACKGKGCLLPLKIPQVVDPSGEDRSSNKCNIVQFFFATTTMTLFLSTNRVKV
jgi:hypothetical protein